MKRTGFTLIELLVVFAIIVILVAMVVPGCQAIMGGKKEKAVVPMPQNQVEPNEPTSQCSDDQFSLVIGEPQWVS